MITREEREEFAALIAAHITNPENSGRIGGIAGPVTAPQAWYLDNNGTARAALVVGFYADNPILATVGTGQVFSVHVSRAFTDYEEALCASAEEQRKRLSEAQGEYLATCQAAAKFLRDAREKSRQAAKRPKA